jgi:hypothetical protein
VEVVELRADLWRDDLEQCSDRGTAGGRVRVVIANDLLEDPAHFFTAASAAGCVLSNLRPWCTGCHRGER